MLASRREICLRCQFRLFYQSVRRFTDVANDVQATQTPSKISDTLRLSTPSTTTPNQRAGQERPHKNRHKLAQSEERLYPAWRYPDIASDRVELPVQRLGEPATIRVLPETRTSRRPKPSPRSKSSKNEAIIVEQGLAGAAEAMNNIENLRKTFLASINQFEGATQAQYDGLVASLERGFTTEQLKDYKRMAPPSQDPGDNIIKNERFSVSTWVAGPCSWSQAKSRFEKSLRPGNKRQQLIVSIISAWGIRPQEERRKDGVMVVQLYKDYLNLLLHQNTTIFHNISESFRVTTEISRNLIKISGPYDPCVDAVRALSNIVQAAKIERIILPVNRDAHDIMMQSKFWEEVESQTSTTIRPIDSAYTAIDVYYLSPKALAGVQRRLFSLRNLDDSPKWTTFPKHDPMSLVPIGDLPNLTAVERNLPWYRLRSLQPTALNFSNKTTRQKFALSDVETQQSIDRDEVDDIYSGLSEYWQQFGQDSKVKEDYDDSLSIEPRTTISASIGHLVHMIPETGISELQPIIDGQTSDLNSTAKTTKSKQKELAQAIDKLTESVFGHRRTLVPGIPFLIRALDQLLTDEPTLSNFFKIVLSPISATINGRRVTSRLPSLELEVSINEKSQTTTLRQTRLVLDRRLVDVSLPRETADVRFKAETYIVCDDNSAVDEFVNASKLDVWGSGNFETPTNLLLTVPKSVFEWIYRSSTPEVSTPIGGFTIGTGVLTDSESKSENAPIMLSKSEGESVITTTSDTSLLGNEQGTHEATYGAPAITNDTEANQLVAGNVESPVELSSHAEPLQIEYSFESLAVHSKLQSLYEGFPLAYSTIEAGSVGGKREDLSIEIPGIADAAFRKDTQDKKQAAMATARPYFVAMFNSVIDLIGRLPK